MFDTKNKEIHFYTSIYTQLVIENYSTVSVFDELESNGKPVEKALESIQSPLIRDYFVTDEPG